MKKDCDNASIGILLCKTKDNIIAEYALKDMSKPIGVSEYKIFEKLPKKYENIFPAKKEIEQKLGLVFEQKKKCKAPQTGGECS